MRRVGTVEGIFGVTRQDRQDWEMAFAVIFNFESMVTGKL